MRKMFVLYLKDYKKPDGRIARKGKEGFINFETGKKLVQQGTAINAANISLNSICEIKKINIIC